MYAELTGNRKNQRIKSLWDNKLGMPRGLLTLDDAEMTDEQMQLLEVMWRDQISGMRGRQRIPILNAPRGQLTAH